MDIFLTLDTTFINSINSIRKERVKKIDIYPKVLLPISLIKECGIESLDEIPVEPDKFYYYHEIQIIKERLYG